MYKVTASLIKTRPLNPIILTDGTYACLALHRDTIFRNYSQDKKYGDQESGGGFKRFFYGLTSLTILTGAGVVYAQHHPEARKFCGQNLPWTDDLFVKLDNTENWSIEKWNAFASFVGLAPQATKKVETVTFANQPKTPTQSPQTSTAGPHHREKMEEIIEEKIEEQEKKPEIKEIAQKELQKSSSAPLSVNVQENRDRFDEYSRLAIDNYKKAIDSIAKCNAAIAKVVEAAVDTSDSKIFTALREAQADRDNAVIIAERAATNAESIAVELMATLPADLKKFFENQMKQLQKTKDAYTKEKDRSLIADKYWDKVEASRKAYIQELQTLFPGIDIASKRLNLNPNDVDLLLLHTMKQVLYLQGELANAQTVHQHSINKALSSREDAPLVAAKVEEVLKKERNNLEKIYQKRALELEKRSSQTVRDELKKQIELHEEIMKDKLLRKEREVKEANIRQVSENQEREQLEYKQQLAIMAAKLKGVEDALKNRAALERTSRKAQALWSASAALHAHTINPSQNINVAQQLENIMVLSGEDELVKAVVGGLPKSICSEGVSDEVHLRDSYLKMEKAAMKLSLVKEDGSPLHIYFISWLMSKFMFKETADIPRSELEDQATDFTNLDTFEILQRARYHMDRGNISQALKYVNLLSGGPRKISSSWRHEAEKHLEAKLAACTLMAHAARSAI